MKQFLHLILLSVLILSYGCEEDMVIIATAPKFEVGEEKDLLRKSVTLCGECTTNMPNVVVGFMLGKEVDLSDGIKYPVAVEAEDGLYTLEQQMTDLEVDDVYYYAIFADADGNMQLSEIKTFRTPNNSLAQVGETVYTVANTLPFSSSVVDNGGADIQGVGFCASTSPNPEAMGVNSIVKNATLNTSNNTFSAVFDNIESNVTYYIRAFAYNGMGFSYGSEIEVVFDVITITDSNFKEFLIDNYDVNGDNEISPAEASVVTSMTINTDNISSLAGIESFVALEYLSCCGDWNSGDPTGILAELDVSQNTALKYFYCSSNNLTSLDVSNNTALIYLSCSYNDLTSLGMGSSTALTHLYCFNNNLTTLDVSKNAALAHLTCKNNNLTSLDMSNNIALTNLDCDYNNLTSLNVGNNIALTSLWCNSNNLTSLDVSNNTALTKFWCTINNLTDLDVSNNTALTSLACNSNKLTSLDVSQNISLTELNCYNNELTSLDVSNNTDLQELFCFSNSLTNLDISTNTALTYLMCHYNNITNIYVWEGFDKAGDSNFVKDDSATYVVK